MIYLEIATKLVIGLAGLLAVARLLGKKEMSQVIPFDFIYALVLGGILEEGIYDKKVSIWQILYAICLWGISVYIIEICAQKSDCMKKLLKGHPSLIIRNGELDIKQMKKNHLEIEQVRTMLRKQGVFTLREVRDLYLEPGGDISVKLHSKAGSITPDMLDLNPRDEAPSILVIEEGKIKEEELRSVKKSKNGFWKGFRRGIIKKLRISYMENGQKRMDSIYSRIPKKTLIYTKKLEDFYFSHRLIKDGTVKTSKIPAVPSAFKKPISQVAPLVLHSKHIFYFKKNSFSSIR
ncbi:DUF421 domain-containing protein [Peribacillus frigoritolerans]|uniref:DUF421 domain-containing protein n=1 Tax=Peribacillus frigoritolerans TaxID=450367 RepID=UPI0034E0C280